MAFSNVADDDATIFYLARKGYGSVDELDQWDSPRIMDAVEFEAIQNDIELYEYEQSRSK